MAPRALPATEGQLAAAARSCPLFDAARTLADWVGTGRDVTTRLVPKPAAAVELCDLLGIEPPSRKPRSALDIPPLMRVWAVADIAGLIEVTRGRVYAGSPLHARADGEVLAAWRLCVQEAFGPADRTAEDDLDCLAALATLHEGGGAVAFRELSEAIPAYLDDARVGCSCPDCAREPVSFPDEPDAWRADALAVAEPLAEFGIVTVRADNVVELTPLGQWLTEGLFRYGTVAADGDAATLVGGVNGLPPSLVVLLSRPWLLDRTPTAAARDLLAVAARTSGAQRFTALTLAYECGPGAEPAWREWAARDGFGAYARAWLADRIGAEPAEADEAWLSVDALVTALDDLPPGLPAELVAEAVRAQADADLGDALPRLAASGHPDAARVVRLLTGRQASPVPPPTPLPPPGPARPGSGYQVEVRLLGVTEPPVWRLVEVPADISLGMLHEVIQTAMGWENCHMHVFTSRKERYGEPHDLEGGLNDEWAVPVTQVLTRVGSKIRYTYDFGDNWHHDVTLKKKITTTGNVVCVAGEGACPPEDCGGVWGYEALKETLADPTAKNHEDMLDWMGLGSGEQFDPAEFSVEAVNQALQRFTNRAQRARSAP